jgi:hypothetical protein
MGRLNRYRQERSNTQRDGGAGLAIYRMERRQAAYRDRWKPYNAPKTVARILTRAIKGPKRRR